MVWWCGGVVYSVRRTVVWVVWYGGEVCGVVWGVACPCGRRGSLGAFEVLHIECLNGPLLEL